MNWLQREFRGDKRFKGAIFGYDRPSVDEEFERLTAKTDELESSVGELEQKIKGLAEEKDNYNRERISMSEAVNSMSGKMFEMESGLMSSRTENASLQRSLEAQRSEANAMRIRFEQLRERDRDYTLREREFAELQSSVASIMSVTKRATDQVFQKAVDSQEKVAQVAGDAAKEVAAIRSDVSQVRQQLNRTLDDLQDRIDRMDAALTGAVHKLVAVKHSDGLKFDASQPSVMFEVERLLSSSGGTAPLGPYGSKFLSDTAKRVTDGRLVHTDNGVVETHSAAPGSFESTEESVLEAKNLLQRGGVTAEEYYAAMQNQYGSGQEDQQSPVRIGFVQQEGSDNPNTTRSMYKNPVSTGSQPMTAYDIRLSTTGTAPLPLAADRPPVTVTANRYVPVRITTSRKSVTPRLKRV